VAMAVSVNVNSKVCATCRWWEGPRELGTYKRDNKGNVIPISIKLKARNSINVLQVLILLKAALP